MDVKEQTQRNREKDLENLVIQIIYDYQQLLEIFYTQHLKRILRKRAEKKQ